MYLRVHESGRQRQWGIRGECMGEVGGTWVWWKATRRHRSAAAVDMEQHTQHSVVSLELCEEHSPAEEAPRFRPW